MPENQPIGSMYHEYDGVNGPGLVETTRNGSEPVEDWEARHLAALPPAWNSNPPIENGLRGLIHRHPAPSYPGGEAVIETTQGALSLTKWKRAHIAQVESLFNAYPPA